jgi:hypothetical protein
MSNESPLSPVLKSIMAERRRELTENYHVFQIPIPPGIKLTKFAKAWSLFGVWIDDCCDATRYGKTVDIWVPRRMVEERLIESKVGSFLVDPRDLDLGQEE